MKSSLSKIIKLGAIFFIGGILFLNTSYAEAAISHRATGSYVEGTANLTPVIPTGAVRDDMMLLIYGTKPYNDAPTIDNGWTSIGSATDGTTAAGVDVGSMQTRIYYKIHTGTESNPTVTNATNNVSGAVIIVFQKAANENWVTPVGAGGGDATAGTGFSVTAASNPGLTSGDLLAGYAAIRSDAGTQSGIAIAATSLTLGSFTESPTSDLVTTSGGDMAMSGGYVLATAGTASAAPVYSSTLAASHTGSAFIARLRVSAGGSCSSAGTGPWATGGTWGAGCTGAGGIPTAADAVTILNTHNVTVATGVSAVANSVTVNSGGTLTITSTGGLSVSGNFTNSSGGTVTGTGYLTLYGSGSTIDGSGTMTGLTGATTLTNNKTISATAALSFGGAMNVTTGSAVTITAGANITVAGTTTVTSTGSVTNNGTFTASGTFTGTGTWTQNNGSTLNLGGADANANAITTFSASTATNTVNYTRSGTQTIKVGTYHNLTLSGTSVKTSATTPTVNGVLSMEGTATITVSTGVVTYGSAATLQYNTSTARSISAEEFISPFVATGGVIIGGTGVITISGSKQIGNNTSVPFTINNGATFDLAGAGDTLTVHGDFINNGSLISAASATALVVGGTVATQSISGYNDSDIPLQMTKTSGVATLTSAITGGALTINGLGGSLNLGEGFTHTFTGTLTRTNGTLDVDSSTLKIASTSGSTGTFNATNGTVEYTGAASAIAVVPYKNLTLSGSGTATGAVTTVTGNLSLSGSVSWSAGAITSTMASVTMNSSGTLTLGAAMKSAGALTVTQGTFNANNFNVTASSLSSSNSNTRVITMGSGTWYMTGVGTVWDVATATNLTINANTSTIKMSDPDAEDFITNAGITDATEKSAIRNLILNAKAHGWWSKMSAVYPFVGGTASTHKYNLKDPRDLDAAFRLTFTGGFTHASTGITPNGSTGWAQTYLNPNTTLPQDSVSASYYSRTTSGNTNEMALAAGSGTDRLFFYLHFGADHHSDMYGSASRASTTGLGTQGFFSPSRVHTTDHRFYYNGVQSGSTNTTANSTTRVSANIELFRQPNSSLYNGTESAFISIGEGMDSTMQADIYEDVQAFQTELGRNVGSAGAFDYDHDNARIFAGGGKTYNNIWYAPGAGTGSLTITGSNTFADFKDDGTSAHSLLFTAGTTTTTTTFTVTGNPSQLITINSGDGVGGTSTSTHSLSSSSGDISSDYLNIQHSVATGGASWYAGNNSTNNNSVATAGSGWIFSAPLTNITISGSATTCAGSPSFTAVSSSCTVLFSDVQTLLNAGTSVSFTAGNNITVSSAIAKTAGGNATISMYASENIIISSAISSNTGTLGMFLNADRDANTSGYINIAAALTTNGGNLTMGGGSGTISASSGYAVGNSGQARGVYINNVNVNAGGGNIIVNGQGYNTTTNNNHGVHITGASGRLQTSGSGTVTISGLGKGTVDSASNYGVYVAGGSAISSVDGLLTVNNTVGGGAGAGTLNHGLYITGSGSAIKTTGTGSISITATGGNASGSGGTNNGVLCENGLCIQTTGGTPGNISITGVGGNSSGSGTSNEGVSIYSSTVAISGAANSNITITGTGGSSSGGFNYGISGGYVTTSGSGTLTLIGTGGGVTNSGTNFGVVMNGGIVSTVNGLLTVTGTGGGAGSGTNNRGVYVGSSNNLQTTGSGNIIVNGIRGGGDTGTNYGLRIFSANAIKTTGTGNITINTDTISLNEADDINSAGTLTIAPYTASGTVGVAGATGTLELSTANLGYLTYATSLQIGNSSQTGTTTVGAYALWAKPISFVVNASGSISVSGAQTNSSSFSFTGPTTLSAALTASNLSIVSGTFNAGSQTITLTGTGIPFLNSGTFTAGTSLIKFTNNSSSSKTFNGGGGTYNNFWFAPSTGTGSLTIYGSNTFNDFKDDGTAAHDILFEAETTTTVSSFTVSGFDATNRIRLLSTDPGASHWYLVDTSGTNTVSYLDINDSEASGGAVWDASNGTNINGSNNVVGSPSWIFIVAMVISGNTNLSDASNVIKIAVGGSLQAATGNISSGSWSISPSTNPTAGQSVIVFVNTDGAGDATESTAISKYDGTGDMDGMVLNAKVLSIGSNNSQTVTFSDIDDYTCAADEDVMHSVVTSVFNIEGQGCAGGANSYSDETLSILASNTLTVGSSETVTTEKITNAGTITSTTTSTYNLTGTSGTLFTNTGTFTQATSTVNLTGNGDATINSGSPTFYNLTSSGTGTKSLGAGITLASSGTLSVTAGTFNPATYLVTGSGSNVLSVGASGTINVDASTFTGNYSAGFGTLTLNAASTTNYNLAGTQTISSAPTYGNLTISGSGTKTLGGNTTAAGLVTVSGGSLDTDSTNNRTLTANKITINGGTLLANASTINLSGTSGTLFTYSSGTFTAGTSTVNLTGNGDAIINSGSPTFNILQSSGTGVKTVGANFNLNSELTLGRGTFDPLSYLITGDGSVDINMQSGDGDATLRIGATTFSGNYTNFNGLIFRYSIATFEYSRSGNQTIDFALNANMATSGSGTKTLSVDQNNIPALTIGSGTTLALDSYNLTLSGPTPVTANGSLDGGTGTVKYTYNGDLTIPSTNITYYNLSLMPTVDGNRTYTLPALSIGGDLNINPDASIGWSLGVNMAGHLTLPATKTITITDTNSASSFLDTRPASTDYNITTGFIGISSGDGLYMDSSSSVLTLTGTSGTLLTKNGTFLAGNSTTTISGNGTATISSASSITFFNLTSSGTGTKTLGAPATVGGNLLISAGTFDPGTSDITVTGTTTLGTGTTFDDTSATGTNIFTGLVTTGLASTWGPNAANSAYTFRGGFSGGSSTTFTSGSGVYTFDTNAQTISSSNTITITNLTNNVTAGSGLTFSGNQPTVTTLSQGTNAVLTFSGTVPTITTLTATASPNTVAYTGSTQIIKDTTYHHLTINSSGTATLAGNTIANGTTTLTAGTLDTNNNNLTTANFSSSNANTRVVTMGSGTWELTGTGAVWDTTTTTGLTVTPGTSTIKLTNNSASLKTFSGGGRTYNNIWFAPSTGAGTFEVRGSNTFNDFKDDGAVAHSILFTAGTTTTVSSFTVTGNTSELITINSGDGAGATSTLIHTLSKSSGVVISDYLNIQHSVATGGASWYAGDNSTNNQGVDDDGSGWIFSSPTDRYWVGGGGDALWTTSDNWSYSSGGGGGAPVPNSTKNVFFNASGNTASTLSANISIRSLDMTGYTNTLTHDAGTTLTIAGDTYKLASGMTYTLGSSSTSATTFTSTTGTSGTPTQITTASKTLGNTTFNGSGGYFQLNDSLTANTITQTAGTLLTNATATINSVSTGSDLTLGVITKNSGSDSTLTVKSGRAVIVGSAISSTSNKLNLILNSDSGANISGYVNVAGAITTNGGALTIGGGAGSISAGNGYAIGNSGQAVGVYINNVGVNAGGGNIIINGQGYDTTTNNNHGVQITGATGVLETSGSGTITISGVGKGITNSASNFGVSVDTGGIISTVNGNLTISNTIGGGAGSGTFNRGVYIVGTNSTIKTTGTGSISITATGGNPSGTGGGNYGINCNVASCIQTTGGTPGTITLNGTGGAGTGAGSSNTGVLISGGGVSSSIVGASGSNISITGTGGASTSASNIGISIETNAQINATGSGTLTLNGTGGGRTNSGSNVGVSSSGTVSTVNGLLTIVANGGGAGTGTANHGLSAGGIKTTGSGNISITATGGNTSGSGGTNYGINCPVADCLQVTSTGHITAVGNGGAGSGTTNYGINLTGSINGVSGTNISLTGNGGNGTTGGNFGVSISGVFGAGVVSTTGAGTLTVTGVGGTGANSGSNYGVIISSDGVLSSTNGTLTVTGTGGGTGIGTNNYGVYVTSDTAGGTIKTTGSGNLIVNGIRGGGNTANNYGLNIATANGLQTTSSGNITVNADTILLTEANDINSVGALTIAPYSAAGTVGVNGGAGTLGLTTTFLGYMTSTSLQIGNSSQTGTTTLGAYALWDKPISFVVNASGSIAVSGAQTNSSSFSFTGPTTLSADLTSSALTVVSGTFNAGSQIITVTGTGTVFSNSGTFIGGNSTIKLTNNSATGKTFAGGGGTFNNFWFAPSTGTGALTISGSNTFNNFKDDGTVAHSILFTNGTTQNFDSWSVIGNPGQLITINSTDDSSTHTLNINGSGSVSSDYLNIQHSVATPSNRWFAGFNSTNNQANASAGSGWLFVSESSYRQGGAGAGGESQNGGGGNTGGGGQGGGGSTIATGNVVLNGSSIESVTITFGGSGYLSAPIVSFCAAVGSGAAGTSVLTGDAVSSVNISNGGTGYNASVTVLFGSNCPTGGGGGGGGGDSE